MIKFVFILALFLTENLLAGPADLIGNWKLTHRTCTDGSQVKTSVNPMPEDMLVGFTATEVSYSRTQGGCSLHTKAPYLLVGQTVQFKVPKLVLTDSCSGAQIEVPPFSFKVDIAPKKLKITTDPLKSGACPAGQAIDYFFSKL